MMKRMREGSRNLQDPSFVRLEAKLVGGKGKNYGVP